MLGCVIGSYLSRICLLVTVSCDDLLAQEEPRLFSSRFRESLPPATGIVDICRP